jgi:hypothetical protein
MNDTTDMKNEIKPLNDMEARISGIKYNEEFDQTTVELEWGGCNDRDCYDFRTDLLGKVVAESQDQKGWAILDGKCQLEVGDLIPLRRYFAVIVNDGPALGIGLSKSESIANASEICEDLTGCKFVEITANSYHEILDGNPDAWELVDGE